MPNPLPSDVRQDISDVLIRYATGIDRRDWTLFRTCWTDDARIQYDDVGSWESGDDFTRFMEVGYYDDELRLTPDGWKIEARRYTKVHFRIGPSSEVI